ncbi:phage tail tape measure protein [Faecalibacterium duncaniae]|uniref:Phage tail tape measure protein, TP901 family n=3 Tax=root TaxID=1 RepID=C7H6H8_FAED2|nr:phage tail tape measure protein [Faecalibacterium duncaniae]YP_009797206.1 tail length tape measure protein [Faecalibacterium phage FP_Lagaffe]ATO99161.1 phage tail tape measure protein [Faecalibacterium duncaniae]AUV56367.1 tail length tape-measure protein [Faecalibacterium phage FP_Lagaffe]EEU96506.1 phage tail tape measure protein, TP901 family [Faecalibacterium duncaniae]MDV5055534.1 phage tail tape measure protein [Faecalibacterium duncaniae]QIA42439.1 phage tail tape measure protein 
MADHTLQSTIEIAGSLSPSLQSAINAAVSRLEEMSKETLEAAGASAQLAAKISTQETVLKNLEQGYADYIVTGQEGTEEAEQLASTIQELSGELTENRGTLDAAEKAARALSETMDDAGGEAETLRSTISKQEDTLQQLKQRYVDVATEQGETSDEARELARQIQDLSSELHENKTKLSDAEYAADKLDNSLEEVESSAKKADDGFTMFKATLANLAADAIMRAVDGIKNLAGNVIELGQNFTSTMSEVSAISGATGEDFEKLEACAREYGATTVFSASNAAEALKYMSLAGWDADQSTSALGGVLNLAAASGMELGAASDMVTDYLSAFAMEAGDAAYFADLLSYAQSHSNTTAEALGEAYKNCAANLNAAGQDVETVTSLLEGMANQGYKGSEAGTAMAAIMRDITNGMKDGAIKIGETSVAVMDAQGNFRDLTDILTEVEAATNGMGDAERAVALSSTFTADSTKGLNLILNEGMDKIAGYEEELRGASGSAEEMANIMNDNLSGDVAAMNSAFEELGLKIYDALESKLRAGVQFITNGVIPAIEWLGGHIPEVTIAVSGLGAVIAAMNWGTISSKIAMVKGALVKLAAALGGVSLPAIAIIAVITAVALAFTNLWKNNEEFRNKITAIWDGIKAKFDEFGQGIVDRLNALGFEFEDITEVMKAVWDGFCEVLAPIFEGVFQQISNILSEALDILTGLFDIFAGIFTGDWDMVWQGVQEVFGAVWDFVVATFENWISTFTSLADTVLGWFGTDWETVWTNVKTFFSDTWNAISSFFSGILTGIKTFFTDTWNAIVSFFSGILSGIYSSVTGTMTEIHDTFTNIWDSITGFLSGAWETIKNIVTVGIMAVKEIISAAFQIITLPFRFIWENCKDTVLSIWETIKSVIGEKIDAVKEKITTVTTAISNVASAAWNAISSTASSLWEGIKGTIGSKIDAAKEKVSTATSAITSVASSAWSSVSSTASSLWNTISSTVSSKISAASSAVSSATSTITSVASSAWSSVSSTASSQWESIRSTISSKLSSAKSTVSSLMSGITSTMSSGLSSALSTVSGKFSSIYSTISSKMSAARDAVGNAISALKSKFNFSWSLPHLKLPHVSISGSFSINPPSVPHFGISWYKDGGILTRPTIFGAAGNNLLAGGEAGAEAVVPLATLWDKLETMITSVFNTASTTGGSSGEGLTSTAGRLLTLDDFSLGSLADSGGVVVYYDFSGFTWSPQIQTEGTGDDADDFMAKLKAHEAEFFDWLEEFIKMREVAQYA